jgi:surface protein
MTSDLSNWNTGAVTNMKYMFLSARSFNQDLSTWKTAAVTNMENMFNGASAFNSDLSTWNTAAVTNMGNMFYDSGFSGTLCGGAWESLTGSANAFENLGTATGRLSC